MKLNKKIIIIIFLILTCIKLASAIVTLQLSDQGTSMRSSSTGGDCKC